MAIEMLVQADNVGHVFGHRRLFSNISFSVGAGQSLAISGTTGCGKSTLLALLTGSLQLREGRLAVAGTSVEQANSRELTTMRLRSVGMVHQSGELIPTLSAVENVMVPMLLTREVDWQEAHDRASELCARFGVESVDLAADSLSGGERQRVALARAMSNQPSVLLADEPTAALDPVMTQAVARQIYGLTHEREAAVIVATHDRDVAAMADSWVVLADGRLEPAASAA